MLDCILKFKSVCPVKGLTIDDGWDQLNRTFMFLLLCSFGMIVTVRQYTGHVISCDGFTKFSANFAEDYCWTQGLYTVSEAYDQPKDNVPYPGILPEDIPPCIELKRLTGGKIKCPDPRDLQPPTRLYHLWYQWVPFYFWLTAIAFYIPYLFYKNCGMGEMKPLIALLHNPVETEEDLDKTINKASTWLYYKFSSFLHRTPVNFASIIQRSKLGIVILFVKLFYLAITLMTFYLTANMFEIGNFITYGRDWVMAIGIADNVTTLVRDKIFPKMTACEIKRWGASGIEEEQGTCVLAPNVINQYLFLILWFALATVMFTNSFSIFVTVIKLVCTCGSYRGLLVMTSMREDPSVKRMYHSIGISGRVILHILAANIRPKVFEDIAKSVSWKLKKNKLLREGLSSE